ncbi:hypothetical protein ACFVVX_08835 [Kitasatospora sp. NPDC058170]|uniref:hypothetical protein n=1 Tax=Kitasatospora sp. NPDC058170 TaxID=3346364 RepID=UPI0036D788B1
MGRVPHAVEDRAWCGGYGRFLSCESDRAGERGSALLLTSPSLLLSLPGALQLAHGVLGIGAYVAAGPGLLVSLVVWHHRKGGRKPSLYCYERGAVLFRAGHAQPYLWSELRWRADRFTSREEHGDVHRVRLELTTGDGTPVIELRELRAVVIERAPRSR